MIVFPSPRKPSRPAFWSSCLALLGLAAALNFSACSAASTTLASQNKFLINTYDATNLGVKIRWYRQPQLYNDSGSILQNVWKVNSSIYLTSSDSNLICLDADTGATTWKINLGYVPEIFRPAETGDYLVVLDRINGVLIDRRNGKIVKRAKLPFACTTDPIITGSTICAGSGADFFYGLYIDLFTSVKFSVHSEAGHDAFLAQPIVTGGRRVVCASRTGLLWCLDPDFGTVIWTYRKVTGNVQGGLGADSRNVYVPSMDNKVFAFDSVDSSYLWDTHFEGTLDQTVVATKGGQLLVPSTGKGIYCLETEKGSVQWFVPDAVHIVSLSPTHVYVQGSDGEIKVIRMSDGKVEKSLPIANVKYYATNLHGATIYAVTAKGQMMAIEPEDIDLLAD